jgi:hypothetical protein
VVNDILRFAANWHGMVMIIVTEDFCEGGVLVVVACKWNHALIMSVLAGRATAGAVD